MGKSPSRSKSVQSQPPANSVKVPAEIIEVLRETTGADPLANPNKVVAALTASVSTSPYPSPEMLNDYPEDIRNRLLDRIDQEGDWRRERMEQDQALQHEMNRRAADLAEKNFKEQSTQQRRSQFGALFISLVCVVLAFIGMYFHLSWYGIVTLIVVGIGGPSSATILARKIKPPGAETENMNQGS